MCNGGVAGSELTATLTANDVMEISEKASKSFSLKLINTFENQSHFFIKISLQQKKFAEFFHQKFWLHFVYF